MATEAKVSVTGSNKAELRKKISEELARLHFRRRNVASFYMEDGLTPNQAAELCANIYEQEDSTPEAQVITLVIRSDLIAIEMKRNKNRSI